MEQNTAKTITFVVPAYNMETYLSRCIESLVAAQRNDDIEVLIVDDGSHDNTPQIADAYERRYPGIVRAIHQENKGHGGAVNTGVAEASGVYVKVVDSDDWIGAEALERVMETLRTQVASGAPIDLLGHRLRVRQGRQARQARGRFQARDEAEPCTHLGRSRPVQRGAVYDHAHADLPHRGRRRASGMQLPEHTFYVDFIYSYHPFPWVKTLMYLDVPFYHYSSAARGRACRPT